MTRSRITAGFIPLIDAAPLIIARECGFAEEEGIELGLVREASWANIRDRIAIGHFEAAHLLAPLALAGALGLPPLPAPVMAPMALGTGRNAISLSNRLANELSAAGFGFEGEPTETVAAIRDLIRDGAKERKLSFAVVHPFSAHACYLRYWLRAGGIDPENDVMIEVVPPPLMVDALRNGRIDACCVGEPWTTVASGQGVSRAILSCDEIWRANPDKVLGIHRSWGEDNTDLVVKLVRAVYRAACWCDEPGNRSALVKVLASAAYLDLPPDIIEKSLLEKFLSFGLEGLRGRFAAHEATFPWRSHALWFYQQMVENGHLSADPALAGRAAETYRPDLYRLALTGMIDDLPTDDARIDGADDASRFFDGKVFDPASVR